MVVLLNVLRNRLGFGKLGFSFFFQGSIPAIHDSCGLWVLNWAPEFVDAAFVRSATVAIKTRVIIFMTRITKSSENEARQAEKFW